MAIQKTDAIVIKTQPFRSSSLIVTFFTRDFGKLKGIAKGVREERQRRSAVFELFTHVEIIFYEKSRSDLHLISETFILDAYEPLRTNLEAISYASYFVELLDKLCEVHDPHAKLFDLLNFSFRYLNLIPGQRVARLFEIKLLHEIGWLPLLDQCFKCHAKAIEEGYFSIRQGALVCEKCRSHFPSLHRLSREALSTMRYYIRHSLEESIRLALTKEAEMSLKELNSKFFLDRLNYPFKSQQFMSSIQPIL